MWRLHHEPVPSGVVDVGSNTVRLHVAQDGRAVFGDKTLLGLGEAVERYGRVPEAKLTEVAARVADYVQEAREHGAGRVEVLVTSPGRQAANGGELLARLERSAGVPVRLLTAVDEARLGFTGALSATRVGPRRTVAVVDVGGGSAQIAVGSRREGPTWIRSIDIGSMRLATRCLDDDPPGSDALRRARLEVESALQDVVPPRPSVVLAVGGSARALRRLTGSARLGPDELATAIEMLAVTPSSALVSAHGLAPARARTVPAGAVILAALTELLGTTLRVVRGGVREGALLELEQRREAA
jgi:exopolyphosphatase/guanosine-5'-triphosphate,3'-diphosphate pyrophosphatase